MGKRNSALETLCDAIRAKKHRSWQKVHEDIMFKYLELAVDLRKSYVAKEGIFQYKLICQQTNIKSFEDVVRKYIELAEEKAEWAKNRAASRTTDDVDDLDIVQTPEEILLSAVSSEDQQDRSERVKLIPWVRFLWEAYRQCLDILKNNVRTEALYHEIAHRAFQFCTKFNRKTEFRKLCDNLRTHMDYLKKTQMNAQQQPTHTQSHMVNLNNPESMAMQLETRLIQLETATQIELWQEAYRATDDIKRYGLLNLNKKPPKPQLMANYYQKLALVFWKADCHLFHAAALFRLFHLTRELKKSITPAEVQRMASKLVLATLTIPIPPNRPDIDKLVDTEENTVEIHQRNLASLLGLTTVLPTRSQLVKDLKRMGYLQHAYQPLQDLYKYLEVDFHPLAICGRVMEVIEFIEKCEDGPDIKNYVEALKSISILRLLKGVSQVYQVIEYDRLSELCPFADSNHLEAVIVEAARRNDLQVRIDHRGRSLHFGTEICVSQSEEIIEGPHLQTMPSEQVRLQLVNTYSTLLRVKSMIEQSAIEQRRREVRQALLRRYTLRQAPEHEAILARHSLIEERKKQLEILGVRMEQEEKLRQEAKQRKLAEEENQRLQQERENRERLLKDKETNEIKTLVAKQKIEASGLKDDLEQAKREQKELQQKQRRLERKIDHLERAKRLQEIPLLEKEYEKRKDVDRKIWQECEDQRIADILAEHELAKTLSKRLHKMKADAEAFAAMVNEKHQAAYELKIAAFEENLANEKTLRMQARRIKRRDERRTQWLTEKKKEEESKAFKAAAELEQRLNEKKREEESRAFKVSSDMDRPLPPRVGFGVRNLPDPIGPDSRAPPRVIPGARGFREQRGDGFYQSAAPPARQIERAFDRGAEPAPRHLDRGFGVVSPPIRADPDTDNNWRPAVRPVERGFGAAPVAAAPPSRADPDSDNNWRPTRQIERPVERGFGPGAPAPPPSRPDPDADNNWRPTRQLDRTIGSGPPAPPRQIERPAPFGSGPPPPPQPKVDPDADSNWRRGQQLNQQQQQQKQETFNRNPNRTEGSWR